MSPSRKHSISKAFPIIIGIVFLISSIGKLLFAHEFAHDISNLFPRSISLYLAGLLCCVELLLALCLITLKRVKASLTSGLVLISIYTVYTVFALTKGVKLSGGFGALDKEINAGILLTRNLLLMGIIIVSILRGHNITIRLNGINQFIALIMIAYAFLLGSLLNPVSFRFDNSQLASVDLKNSEIIYETLISNDVHIEKDKLYLIYIFDYSCDHCINSIENLKLYEEASLVDEILAITSENEEEKEDEYRAVFDIQYQIISINRKELVKITQAYPTFIFYRNGKIENIIHGMIDHPFINF